MALGILSLSLSNTFLLLPPAAASPDRLVMIYAHLPNKAIDQISYPGYKYYRAGVGATVLLRSQFYGIGAVEWTVLVPAAAAMLTVALTVAYFSARSWITINPMDAVRHA